MKVLLINGSPNEKGNTYHGCTVIAKELNDNGIDTEIYNLSKKSILPCNACAACFKTKDNKCIQKDDLNDLIAKCLEVDGIILSSPIHYADISGLAKNAFDRMFYVSGANGNIFRHKVGASFVAVRRTGGIAGFQTLNNYLLYSEMFVTGSSYWNVIHGAKPEEIYQDAEGLDTLKTLGSNMAFLMKVLDSTSIDKPEKIKKAYTNFIR